VRKIGGGNVEYEGSHKKAVGRSHHKSIHGRNDRETSGGSKGGVAREIQRKYKCRLAEPLLKMDFLMKKPEIWKGSRLKMNLCEGVGRGAQNILTLTRNNNESAPLWEKE